MSWRDDLQPASFRDVEFHVQGANRSAREFADEQHFPGRSEGHDAVHVEHIGAGPRRHQVEAWCVGDDFHRQRDRLEGALAEPGPGRLVLPTRGARMVSVVGDVQTQESFERRGFAIVRFTVVETEEPPAPVAVVAIEAPRVAVVAALADAVDTAALGAAPSSVLDKVRATYDNAAEKVKEGRAVLSRSLGVGTAAAGRVDALAVDIASAPGEAMAMFAETAFAVFEAARSVIAIPGSAAGAVTSALDVYRGLLEDDEAKRPPLRSDERRLRGQVRDYALGTWIAAGCAFAAQASYDSRRQAIETRTRLLGIVDDFLASSSAGSPTVHGANLHRRFGDLRAALAARLDAAAATLPEVETVVLRASLPALVVAHRHYGDATRADDIIARNQLAHPELTARGTGLELLRENP